MTTQSLLNIHQLNNWIECKEAYVLKRYLENKYHFYHKIKNNISLDSQNLPSVHNLVSQSKDENINILILQDENIIIENISSNTDIKIYIYECQKEDLFDTLKSHGFSHICNSKDDHPILLFEKI